jgi:hypothetical protein
VLKQWSSSLDQQTSLAQARERVDLRFMLEGWHYEV